MADPKQIAGDLRGSFRGRLQFDGLTRGLYSTDASPFQVMPLGVAFPEDADDLAALVRYCSEHAAAMIPRGAGTGIAGESLGPGLVVDLSRHFRRIVAVGPNSVTVEPGVVLAELNAELAKHGRRFAPDPASGGTCTVGGMVATNASGGNAFRHGYTRDHVLGLDVVWDNGTADSVGQEAGDRRHETGGRGQEAGDRRQGAARTEEIRAAITELIRANRELIHLTRPQTAFNRCGYLLHDALTDAGLDLARLLVGSEGTLGFVTRATLRTVPLPGGVCVALLGFPSVGAAVRAGLDLRAAGPVGCDLLDHRLLSATRAAGPGPGVGLVPPAVGAALVLTIEADTEREAAARGREVTDRLRGAHVLRVLADPTCDPAGTARIRGVRDAAVAGLYGLGRGPRPLAFVEDVGVPPELVLDFLTQAQDVLKRFELTGSFLIHALTGQVHTRPLIDMEDPADREKMWPVAEAIHAAALALGGTVSTQHGTGIARTPWVEKQYGPLMPVFRELKRIFDPKGLLNPGKIVGPDPSRPAWPLRTEVRGQRTEVSPASDVAVSREAQTSAEAPPARTPLLVWKTNSPADEAAKCTGCGDCRTTTAGRMCPVFRATGDEVASPRAKANLHRLLTDPTAVTADDVRAVAELCVNCKMCRDECPSRVDVSKLMLEAKAADQAESGLDRAEWVLARAESFAATGSNFAPVVNALLGRRSVRWVLEKLFGVSRRRRLPAFAMRNFVRRARGMGLTRKRGMRNGECGIPDNRASFRTPSSEFRITKVAYFVDVFANYNDPLIGEATVAVLRHHGVEVFVPPRQVGCGIAPLVQGDVEAAKEAAVRNVRALADLVREGYRVVCSEPTAALMLSQDYRDLLDDPDTAAVAANTTELTSFLWDLRTAGRLRTDFRPLDLTVGHHVPCHLKALRGPAAGPGLLSLIPGVRVRTIDVSCSGMAGTWGLKAANYETSLAAGRPMLRELNRPGVLFGSTECSACRMQMEEGTGKRTLHPVQYLAYAYGLLPEIGAKLRKPLGELVSD